MLRGWGDLGEPRRVLAEAVTSDRGGGSGVWGQTGTFLGGRPSLLCVSKLFTIEGCFEACTAGGTDP